MRKQTIAVVLALIAFPAMAESDDHKLVFECRFQDINEPAESVSLPLHKFAALGEFQADNATNSPIVAVFDPDGLLEGGGIDNLALTSDARQADSFNWILRSKEDAEKQVLVVIAPANDPKEAIEKNEYIGTLGFENEPKPRWVSYCRIHRGKPGVDYFDQLHSAGTAQ